MSSATQRSGWKGGQGMDLPSRGRRGDDRIPLRKHPNPHTVVEHKGLQPSGVEFMGLPWYHLDRDVGIIAAATAVARLSGAPGGTAPRRRKTTARR